MVLSPKLPYISPQFIENELDEVPEKMKNKPGEEWEHWVHGHPLLIVDCQEIHDGGNVATDHPDHVNSQPWHQQIWGLRYWIENIL